MSQNLGRADFVLKRDDTRTALTITCKDATGTTVSLPVGAMVPRPTGVLTGVAFPYKISSSFAPAHSTACHAACKAQRARRRRARRRRARRRHADLRVA